MQYPAPPPPDIPRTPPPPRTGVAIAAARNSRTRPATSPAALGASGRWPDAFDWRADAGGTHTSDGDRSARPSRTAMPPRTFTGGAAPPPAARRPRRPPPWLSRPATPIRRPCAKKQSTSASSPVAPAAAPTTRTPSRSSAARATHARSTR